MGFNSGFKGLMPARCACELVLFSLFTRQDQRSPFTTLNSSRHSN